MIGLYHVVPPPYTRNYMPSRADLSFVGLDNSIFKSKVSETITDMPKIKTNASKTSKDSLEKLKTVRSSAPLIEDWESDSEDKNVFEPKEVKKTVKPSLEKIKFVNANNTTVENENKAKKPWKFSQSPRVPVNAAKQSSQRAAASVSATRHVNTVASRPNMNSALPTTYSYFKAHSLVRRPFNQKSAAKTNNFNEKVNTAKDQGIFDSGCSRHMTGNKSHLTDYQEIDGGFYVFGGNAKRGKITGKVLSHGFKFLDESQVLLKVPRNNNMYSFDLKNVVLVGGRKPAISFMRPFGCLVTILNTLDHLGIGPNWMFDIDTLTMSMNYQQVFVVNQTNGIACTKANIDVGQVVKTVLGPQYDLAKEGDKNDQEKDVKDQEEVLRKQFEQASKRLSAQGEAANTNSTNKLNTVSSPVNAVSSFFTTVDPGRERAQRNEFKSMFGQDKDTHGNRMFTLVNAVGSTYDNLGGLVLVNAATLPNTDLPIDHLMPDLEDTTDLKDSRIFSGAYDDEVEDPEKVWRLVDLPKGKHAIRTKGVYRNKKDERGIVVRNKTRLVAQGYTQEEGINYDEVFAPVARIKALRFDAQEVLDEFYGGAHFLFKVAVKTASTLIEANKALLKDEEDEDMDVHLYRSMIRIFRYLKGQTKLGLWYPRDSPFYLEAFLDSDYAGASLDRKSTIRGCQFLKKRLISWQCKKQTVVANLTTKVEYAAAANCYGHVLWI
nr:ribonuclease H-like domain, reverse transcriptase, RNA-dependent DNA polymerase [Tanacetum cinerariifolium]